MAEDTNAGFAVSQYRVRLEPCASPGVDIPAQALLLSEHRSGGWTGNVRVNPKLVSPEGALQTLAVDGLVAGAGLLVKLVLSGDSPLAGASLRIWPSVVTSVQTVASTDAQEPEAFCALTFRDPVSYFRNSSIWIAYKGCSLAEMLGGALTASIGGDGKPTTNPLLPGLPVLRIRQQVRADIEALPYAIATGEPLGYWLNRVYSRLGVRVEMWGDLAGKLQVNLCDAAPAASRLNSDGGVPMTLDYRRWPSATNLSLSALGVNARGTAAAGGLLDSLASSARRFGSAGPVKTVITATETSLDEGERRIGFRQASRALSGLRVSMTSAQPGLLPERILKLSSPSEVPEQADASVTSILGVQEWQVADVAHLCAHARYWNQVDLEEADQAWRPAAATEEGATVVAAVIDDGKSVPGEQVRRDRLGRIPVKFPFFVEDPDGDPASGDNGSAGDAWPPAVHLAPLTAVAGNLHGFVATHRQGDWCRVSVIHPLRAEIVGFCHRDDRFLSAGVRDATMGIVMRENNGDWRGLLFRPDEDLPDEIPPASNETD